MGWWKDTATALIEPVTVAVKSRGKIKEIRAKAHLRETLSEAEWELIGKKIEGGTWKDEWVTVIFTSPIIMQILGTIFNSPDTVESANNLIQIIPNYGVLLTMVVGAAIARRVKL